MQLAFPGLDRWLFVWKPSGVALVDPGGGAALNSVFSRAPRRPYSTATAGESSPPLGPWFAPPRSDDRRDRVCSNGSRTGVASAASGIEHQGRSILRTRPRCL